MCFLYFSVYVLFILYGMKYVLFRNMSPSSSLIYEEKIENSFKRKGQNIVQVMVQTKLFGTKKMINFYISIINNNKIQLLRH